MSGEPATRTIASNLRGARCPGPARPGGEPLRCAQVVFRPGFGPAGTRQIVAVVTEHGIPVATLPVARFQVGSPAILSAPGRLELIRRGGGVVIAWSSASVATGYTASVKLSDGRMLGFSLAGRCRGVFVRGVGESVGASVEVAGLRVDLVSGPFARGSLGSHRSRAGSGQGIPHPIC